MSYQRAKGRTHKGRSHTQLWYSMHDSPAWLSLSVAARCVWFEIMRRHNGYNNGEIPLACREAGERCNISKNTAWEAFNELQEKGFIKVASIGGFRVKSRYSTRWIITHYPLEGEAPTNEWRDWKPDNNTQ